MKEEKYRVIGSFESKRLLVEMNDGSGYTVVYENGRISSARFENITEFDIYGFAMAYRKGEKEPSLMISRKGDIYQLTKVSDLNATRNEDEIERKISARRDEQEIRRIVDKNGRVRIF